MEKTNFVAAVCLVGMIMAIHQMLKFVETITAIILKFDVIPVWNGWNLMQLIVWLMVFIIFLIIYDKMEY